MHTRGRTGGGTRVAYTSEVEEWSWRLELVAFLALLSGVSVSFLVALALGGWN